jgi:hypothetical protein
MKWVLDWEYPLREPRTYRRRTMIEETLMRLCEEGVYQDMIEAKHESKVATRRKERRQRE